mgnify:CR=1 FL=1
MIPVSSRRTFIKGLPLTLAGVAASSPLWDRLIGRAMAQTVTQKRFMIFWIPDGLVPEWFWHQTPGELTIRSDRAQDSELTGTNFDSQIPAADRPTFVLQPLASYAKQITLIKGVSNAGGGDHGYSVDSTLTGEEITAKGQGSNPSIDSVIAAANKTSNHKVSAFRTGVYVKQTHLSTSGHPYRDTAGGPMLEITSSPTTDARVMLDSVGGRAKPATGGTTPTTPTTPTGPDPAVLKSKGRLLALGTVTAEIEAMKCRAGTAAANRLTQYIDDLHRVEKLAMDIEAGGGTDGVATTPFSIPSVLNPSDAAMKSAEGDTKKLNAIAPFVRELVISALALDYAPSVALHWGATGNNKVSGNNLVDYRYDFLPGFENMGAGEHGLAHPANNGGFGGTTHVITTASSARDRVRVRRWFFNQMKLVMDRLSSTADGDGSLMDNTTILFASEFGGPTANGGAQHSNRDLPYMILGGKNSPFRLGQAMTVSNRKHGDFLLTLAKGMGSTVSAVGKGTATIDGILK